MPNKLNSVQCAGVDKKEELLWMPTRTILPKTSAWRVRKDSQALYSRLAKETWKSF
ncbi:hypothetical protein HanXRQr2_Chr16g0743911 [Helianthus annuus]|uniref:Uncharacterized protein n=1 Tax=Helianthus annuus TaxID=4232 RepID=A0A9K3DQV0_HELAN|nr:hypothetical protein HanXRQr2_Chr16g0743911 [Helianthus annuus]